MPATTIKLESDLINKVVALRVADQSISGFVRGLIEREYLQQKMRKAAGEYQRFLDRQPDERDATEAWESAPLTELIEPRRKSKR